MTEFIPPNLEALLDEMERQHKSPPSGDPVIAAMSAALPEIIHGYPRLGETIIGFIDQLRPDVPVSEAYGKLRATMQYAASQREIKARQKRFPYQYDDPLKWHKLAAYVESDISRLLFTGMILNNLPVNTTNQRRYGPLEIGRQLMAGALGTGRVDWIDYGSSVRLGANAVHLKDAYPFEPVTVFEQTDLLYADGTPILRPNDTLTKGYNALQDAPSIAGETLCIDAWPARDRLIRNLALTALRPVSEIGNPQFIRRFKRFMDRQVPGVHFQEADIRKLPEIQEAKGNVPFLQPKVAFMGTVANQLGQEAVPAVLQNVLAELDGDGDLYVLDFATVDPADPSHIVLSNTWGEWEYNLLRIGKDDPYRVHHLMSYKNSRPAEAVIGPGLAKGPGGLLPMREHLLRAAERT